MKQVFLFTILLCGLLFTTGCNKFLEEQSQNEIRPSTIDDLRGLMSAEGYPYQVTLDQVTEFMTDNLQCNGGQGQANYTKAVAKGRAPFTWSKDVYEDLLLPDGFSNKTFVNSWETIYGQISGCNVVLDYIDKVSGSEADKNNLRGQALAMRAYYYFLLVNMYGKPYNMPGLDPANSPGVPLRLRLLVTDSLYPRNSVAEVYHQVEADLKTGTALMKAYPQNNGIYKMSPLAAYAMLSRMYLYQEKWEQSITYADSAIALKPGLTQLSGYLKTGGYYVYNTVGTPYSGTYQNRIYDPGLSTEIIWKYMPHASMVGSGTTTDEVLRPVLSPTYSAIYKPVYTVSNELLQMYDARPQSDTAVYLGDLRLRTYFRANGIIAAPIIYYFFGGSYGPGGLGIRVSEMYLNRAEARIQLAIKTGNTALLQPALDDLNTLRSARYDSRKAYEPVVMTNVQQALGFCRDERRKEFPFEGHRWFDLRRYGMPSITHFYEEDPGTGQTFTLAQGDNRYTLPIPKAALERNGLLSQNP